MEQVRTPLELKDKDAGDIIAAYGLTREAGDRIMEVVQGAVKSTDGNKAAAIKIVSDALTDPTENSIGLFTLGEVEQDQWNEQMMSLMDLNNNGR